MGRTPCCEKMGLKKGPWTPAEDQILISHIQRYGHDNWRALPKQAGLLRCGKSCRLRWTNYLRPDIKRGNFSEEEEETIVNLHQVLGNRWSAIATSLPGRTDNEIKNFWHTHLKKKHKKNLTNNLEASHNFSTHRRIDSAGYATISTHTGSDIFSGASPSIITTTTEPTHMSASRNIPETSEFKRELLGDVSTKNQILYSQEFRADRMGGINVNACNDMVFWYNLFMGSGSG